MSVYKEHQYPVAVEWERDRLTRTSVAGKPRLPVAAPPEFHGPEGVWSPEDMLVGAVATCYAITVAALAEHRELTLGTLGVHATGHVTKRDDGRFGFVAIELTATITTPPEQADAVERAATEAKERCIVSTALEVPVHVAVHVNPAAATAA